MDPFVVYCLVGVVLVVTGRLGLRAMEDSHHPSLPLCSVLWLLAMIAMSTVIMLAAFDGARS